MSLTKTNIGRLRIVGFLEGISYLLLMGIAMPLKYIWEMPEATIGIGYAHGILFVLYVTLILPAKMEHNWDIKTSFLVFIASLLPFGTFVADTKIFKKEIV